MVSKNLKSRLGAAIERYVSRNLTTYENYDSGVNDVKRFFFAVADELQLNGYDDDRIMAIYKEARGNYLLGKKYGVTAKLFAERILKQGNKMYTFDKKLPATGYRDKAKNESLVRFSLKETPSFMMRFPEDYWRFNLAVDTSNLTYNAVIRRRRLIPPGDSGNDVREIHVEIPGDAIEALLVVAMDPEFMALKRKDVFPEMFILDGVDVMIDIRSRLGRFRMEDNTLMMTEEDGIIRAASKEYQTGIHLIRKAISQALGEEWETMDCTEEEK